MSIKANYREDKVLLTCNKIHNTVNNDTHSYNSKYYYIGIAMNTHGYIVLDRPVSANILLYLVGMKRKNGIIIIGKQKAKSKKQNKQINNKLISQAIKAAAS